MALLPLYRDPRYTPSSAFTIAAISDLLGNLFQGVGGLYESRKERELRAQAQQAEADYRDRMASVAETAETRLGEREKREAAEFARSQEQVPEWMWRESQGLSADIAGPPQGVAPTYQRFADILDIRKGQQDLGIAEQKLQSLLKGAELLETEIGKYGMPFDQWEALQRLGIERARGLGGGMGGWDKMDRGLAQELLGNLDELMMDWETTMGDARATGDATTKAKADAMGINISRRISQVKSLLPNRGTIEEIESRIDAADSQDDANMILQAVVSSPELNALERMYLETVTPYAIKDKPISREDYLGTLRETVEPTGGIEFRGGFGTKGYLSPITDWLRRKQEQQRVTQTPPWGYSP